MTAYELADELEKDIHWIQDELARKWVVDMLRQQQAEIEALKKEMWMTEVNVQQQTLAHIIKLLTIQHDTLACTSYPMSKKNREAIKK